MATQLKAEDRGVIAQRNAAGVSDAMIARELHRHPRTIAREIARNSIAGVYCPAQAQKLTERRRSAGRAKCRKMSRPENVQYVQDRLRQYWSPDQIAGRSRRDFPADSRRQLSRQLIYGWLSQYDHRQPLEKCLRRHHRARRRPVKPREQPANAVANRPDVVNHRSRYGDWEGDTIVGPGSAALVSLVERRSGFLALLPASQRRAIPVRQAICGRLTQLPPEMRRSLTLDNGSEFSDAKMLENAVGLDVYRTKPHSPWQRGSIENLNGLIRQYFPKRTRFQDQSRYRVAQVEQSLNRRPRKRLNYQTPSEIFLEQCQRAIQT